MTEQQRIEALQRLAEHLQKIQDSLDVLADGMDYGTIARFSRTGDALAEAQRHTRTTINLLRAHQRAQTGRLNRK